ncbi:MAG: hypothetical protein ACM359_22430 [Bacillota bacterium]
MFFNSFDRDASNLFVRRRINKRAAALAVAVATTLPTVGLTASHVYGMTEVEQALVLLAEQAKLSDAELLTAGTEQYNKGLYEEAQATLQQIKVDGLAAADREKLTEALKKVEGALSERKAARAEFELGEQSLADKKADEAIKHYRSAAENKFADSATKTKAASQLAVAQANVKSAKQDLKGLYKEAVADYKADRFDAAKGKFEQLAAAGYKGGLFDKKPGEFLKDIEKKQAEAKTAPAAVAENKDAAEKKDAAEVKVEQAQNEAPKADGKQAYEAGVAAYKGGDMATAKVKFAEAQGAGYKPGLFKDSPGRYLAMIEAKEQKATPAMAAEAATTQPIVDATSPAQKELQETARLESLRKQQRTFEAQQLVEKAQEAQKDNRVADAYGLYAQAVELDATNKAAVEGKAQTQLAVTGGNEKPLIERETDRIRLLQEVINYSFDKAIADSKAATAKKDFVVAKEALDAAVVAKESHPGIFKAEQLARFDTVVANARVDLAKAQEAEGQASAATAADEAAKDVARRQQQEQEERRRTVQSLAKTAKQLVYDGQYSQALGVINQILVIDPTNDYAVGVKQVVQDYAVLQEQRRIREKIDREFEKQLNAAEERKIPYLDTLVYPTNWPDISETRDRGMAEERGDAADDLQVQAALDKNLPGIKFEQAPLAAVVDFMQDVSGSNIYVAWPVLKAAGVDRDTKVSVTLHNVKFSKALQTVLADASAGAPLGYTIDQGVIWISTSEELNKNTTVQVYDIRDLLVTAPDFVEPPDFAPARSRENADRSNRSGVYNGSGTRSGGGGGRYSNWGNGANGNNGSTASSSDTVQSGSYATNEQRTQERVNEIMTLIRETIDRESWIDNGGKFGSLKYLTGQLIVNQTPENQRKMASLLDKLRETRAIQVSIETRFLTVARNFMEDIGVDIDFFFNINDPTHFSPISVSQGSSKFTENPATLVPGSLGASTTQSQPAMTIQGSFLDDFQANFLIRATQAAKHSSTVNAPRVTVFNGQPAFVIVAQEQSYVSDLEAVTGEGVGLFNPIIDVTASGVRLIVQPTVSADRKYVTLALQPTVTQLVNLASYPVFGFANENGNNNGNNGGNNTPGQPDVMQANVQLPIINVTAVNTIVSVPDGGTLLLGGQTIAGEVELEEGVPILSKIPFIKRLFTNKSTAKDEQILLILCKPTIIIHREIEQQQFPLLNAKR